MTELTPADIGAAFDSLDGDPPGTPMTARLRMRPELSDVDIHLEVHFPERVRALSIRTGQRIEDRDLFVATGVRCLSRDGRIEVQAQPGVDKIVFTTLVADLIHHLAATSVAPAAALVHRIRTWQAALSRGPVTGLSAEARLGLFGELLVLREIVLPACGPLAVQAWRGPAKNPKDVLVPPVGVEVKTVTHRDPDRCRISSERQLDTTDLDALYLVHQSVRTAAGGVTLADLVDGLRADPILKDQQLLLEERLMAVGWLDIHRPQYANESYSLALRRCFHVELGFPRLVPADLPAGVEAVSYLVKLDLVTAHAVREDTVRSGLAAAVRQERFNG